MEPNQYFEKYKKVDFRDEVIGHYVDDLNNDVQLLINDSAEKTAQAFAVAVEAVNDKHNAVMDLYESNGLEAPLVRDAFIICTQMLRPEIKRYLKKPLYKK